MNGWRVGVVIGGGVLGFALARVIPHLPRRSRPVVGVTFEEARHIVAKAERDDWRDLDWIVSRDGYEDATHWRVERGVRVQGGEVEGFVGMPAAMVDKMTGELTYLPYISHLQRMWAMTPVRARD